MLKHRGRTITYDSAQYFANDTNLDREIVFKTLFKQEPGFNASICEELDKLLSEDSISVPTKLTVRDVSARVDEKQSTVTFSVRIPQLHTGTQKNGQYALRVFRGDEFSHYKVQILAN